MPIGRKKAIRKIAALLGNAAAHIVLYRNALGIREALLYLGQAQTVAEARRWNDQEIARCRELAFRRAEKELRRRIRPAQEPELAALIANAQREIDAFIAREMR